LLAGPIFAREWMTAPRQMKHFLMRAGYVGVLWLLIYIAHHITFGFQPARNVGDVARYSQFVFGVFAVVQLTVVLASALLFGSANVTQEKDRRTLILLLMTDMRSSELVLGKLCAGLLPVGVLILVSLPVFCLLRILGGVTMAQVLWLEGLCLAAAFAAGSWASLVAYWREKTFQTLAISALGPLVLLVVVEAAGAILGATLAGNTVLALNPYRALASLLNPLHAPDLAFANVARNAWQPLVALTLLGVILTSITVAKLRVWNPSRTIFNEAQAKREAAERKRHRVVWENPVVWREMRTRAYGHKILAIKAAYLVLAGFVLVYLRNLPADVEPVLGMIAPQGFAFVGLALVSLLLVNAQAVTALTSERDGQTLELLLATDITPKEFVYGKLGGIFYNMWPVLAVPVVFVIIAMTRGDLTGENAIYVLGGYLTLAAFSGMLGLHSGISHDISRSAITNSMGTVFLLFIGSFVCMMLIVEAGSSFTMQLAPFGLFILGGSLWLLASLTKKNPSRALMLAAFGLPSLTFYAILAFLLENTLGVFCVVFAAYGGAMVAMLIPAVSAFDFALDRSSADRG